MTREDPFMRKVYMPFCKDSVMKRVLLDGNSNVLVGVKYWKMFTDILEKGFYSLGCRKAG